VGLIAAEGAVSRRAFLRSTAGASVALAGGSVPASVPEGTLRRS